MSVDDKLNDLLCISELLISYSSTIIEEMFNFKKPVLLLNLFNKYNHLEIIILFQFEWVI